MKRNYFLVALIFLTFFVISFLTNIVGPLVPDIINSFDLSLTLVALLPVAFFIAFLGALLFSRLPNYIIFIGSLFLIGTGMAMFQVVINPLLRVAGGEEHFAFNSVAAQLLFGLASFLWVTFLALDFGRNRSLGISKNG